jgi:8-oxo-dGTP diphosphatase
MLILATLCYIKRDGCTLMVHRTKKANDIHEGKWNGLGGKFEAGETPEGCVKREVQEETGLVIQNPHLHGLLMFPNFKGNDWYVFVFTATEFSGELIDSPEGKLEWIPDDKLSELNLWESDHIFMSWIQDGKFFSAKFDYEGEQMLGYDVAFHSQEI